MRRIFERVTGVALLVGIALAWAHPGAARVQPGDPEYQDLQGLEKDWQVGPFAPAPGQRVQRPAAIPDIFGPGAVLSVGNVFMKCTNYGLDGNPFSNLSSDPSGQWKGASSIEYLNYIGIGVGAVNPFATDPTAVRRVSYLTEWRPPTLDEQDRMYRSYDGILNGERYRNEDGDVDPITGDPRIDEDFLDGRDNDGDGLIDEDFGALGQEEFTCVMRDDTPQAINASAAERHVPLGLELRKSDWAYSIEGYKDFNVIQYDIYNRSGHTLDSVVIAFRTDMDCGPIDKAGYWTDDFNLPYYPHGDFMIVTKPSDLRLQPGNDRGSVPDAVTAVNPDSALCPRYKLRVQGWSCKDDDGDNGKTLGIATVMLIDHTIDPTGQNGPSKVGIRAFRSFPGGTPYVQGGAPTIDQQRFEFMTGHDNIDDATGFITQATGDQKGDYSEIVSIGPWLHLADGGHLSATLAFGVSLAPDKTHPPEGYTADYNSAVNPTVGAVTDGIVIRDNSKLIDDYPSLANALAAQIAFEGGYEVKVWPWLTDGHGRETPERAPPGQILSFQGCTDHDPEPRQVDEHSYKWFDFDCDWCTGAYSRRNGGLFHRTWVASSPPPSPANNTSAAYNYSDNPDRRFIPAGDGKVLLAWDNLSETTPDPKVFEFDFRGYQVWKVSNWQRPVGAGGPFEDDWTLLHEYRLFDSKATNAVRPCPAESIGVGKPCPAGTAPGDTLWPTVFIPNDGTYQTVKLYSGDLFDRQNGTILRADPTVLCVGWPNCETAQGFPLGLTGGAKVTRTKYPIGRYHIVDTQVKNGFVYFYSVTAFDSTGVGLTKVELQSSRLAVEADAVVPQASVDSTGGGKKVWVVPNPYRGVKNIAARPSTWDLIPNASDPTGTHIDFFGLPRGNWKIKIFTVSGDLVVTLGAQDAVNESIRPPITDSHGQVQQGYNRQQDDQNDGQARWNLISRNGQDVVSGIYLFTVELGGTVKHRGKFVIIR